jgi:hypothetical protein
MEFSEAQLAENEVRRKAPVDALEEFLKVTNEEVQAAQEIILATKARTKAILEETKK